VQFWEKKDLGTNNVTARLKVPDISKFSIAPGTKPYKIAAFVKEKKVIQMVSKYSLFL
jgi:hypothetical protein